jgi:glycosyltransferase involved in cell wall biosynthesis
MKKLSFCITCKNRFHQISKTLRQNLDSNINISNDIEFVLVDFDSNDGLSDWVIENFQKEIESGYLKYFFCQSLPSWDCSIAKNTSHMLASGQILVNLDCDNFTGFRGGEFILKQFMLYGPKLLLHQASGSFGDGSFGRISIMKHLFLAVGGYDQSFAPMAYQDTDLILRSMEFGLIYILKTNPYFNKAIYNTKEEGILYAKGNMKYREMDRHNRSVSLKNISNGNIIANVGKNIGVVSGIYTYDFSKFAFFNYIG